MALNMNPRGRRQPQIRREAIRQEHGHLLTMIMSWLLVAEDNGAANESKRQKSTSKTLRNNSARAWAPFDYDNVMGIGPVGSSSDAEDNSAQADLYTRAEIAKPPNSSPQTVPNDSGDDKGSKGRGSANLQEATEFGRTQLEIPAACASQGAIDGLRIGLLLRQDKSTLLGVFVCSSRNHHPSMIAGGLLPVSP